MPLTSKELEELLTESERNEYEQMKFEKEQQKRADLHNRLFKYQTEH